MLNSLIKIFTLFLVLLGCLLIAALAQTAQYITSSQAARTHTYSVYLEHAALPDQVRIQTLQAVAQCELGLPIKAEVKTIQATGELPVEFYNCLSQRGLHDVVDIMKSSDKAMANKVSWPLSLFW